MNIISPVLNQVQNIHITKINDAEWLYIFYENKEW